MIIANRRSLRSSAKRLSTFALFAATALAMLPAADMARVATINRSQIEDLAQARILAQPEQATLAKELMSLDDQIAKAQAKMIAASQQGTTDFAVMGALQQERHTLLERISPQVDALVLAAIAGLVKDRNIAVVIDGTHSVVWQQSELVDLTLEVRQRFILGGKTTP